jgi:hypothetical protein
MTATTSAATRRGIDDPGSTSLSVVLLMPVFIVLAFAAWQSALWSHARTEARVAARDTAALVARSNANAGSAAAATASVLASDTALRNIDVTITEAGGIVVVTIYADAPGIMAGTSRSVSVTVAVPVEEITEP